MEVYRIAFDKLVQRWDREVLQAVGPLRDMTPDLEHVFFAHNPAHFAEQFAAWMERNGPIALAEWNILADGTLSVNLLEDADAHVVESSDTVAADEPLFFAEWQCLIDRLNPDTLDWDRVPATDLRQMLPQLEAFV